MMVTNFVTSIASSILIFVVGQLIVSVVASFVGAATYVMAGSIVAPSRKTGTALVLIAIAVVISLIAMILLWSGVETPWFEWRDPGSPLSIVFTTLASIVGWLMGFYWVRDDEVRRTMRSPT
jgi:hypothetical protein